MINSLLDSLPPTTVLPGAWTPIIGGSVETSGQTYSIQTGRYIKVGKLIYFWGVVVLSNKGIITGNVEIQGLPFRTGPEILGQIINIHWSNLATTWVEIHGLCIPNVTKFVLAGAKVAASSSTTALTTADISNISGFVISGTYLVVE